MKKYTPPHLLVKLGILLASNLIPHLLLGNVSDALQHDSLLEDWNHSQTEKPANPGLNSAARFGLNHNFFPIEADLPKENMTSQTGSKKNSMEEAVGELNYALNQALSPLSTESLRIITPIDVEKAKQNETAYENQAAEALKAFQSWYAEPKESVYKADPATEPKQKTLVSQSPPSHHSLPSMTPEVSNSDDKTQPILIRFNNVSIIEYLRFVSNISHKNFIFDENDLQFNITMISEEPTTIEDFMMTLLQELRIHDLTLLEQGNNLVIHKNPKVNNISTVITDESGDQKTTYEIVTQIFRLNTADAEKIVAIIRPLISERAIVDVVKDSNHIILTDIVSNVTEIGKLIKSLDSPKSGFVIGQYVVRTSSIDSILPIVQQLMGPISADQSIQYVPFIPSNSIFVVSTPFLVERALSILQHLDQNEKSTKILNLKDLRYGPNGSQTNDANDQGASPPGFFINDVPFDPTKEPPGTEKDGADSGAAAGWKVGKQGNWSFKIITQPGQQIDPNRPPKGKWTIDRKGNWLFIPGGVPTPQEEQNQPQGHWEVDPAGNWQFDLDKGESISINVLSRSAPEREELLPGSRPKGQFFLHKVHYRKGEELQRSFQAMSDSIRDTENIDPDLVNALASVQWLESSNSLVFSGTPDSLKKIAVLVDEIDIPLRQVFIEMLVLEASLVDTLNYSVKWGNRFGGGNWAGADGFDSTFPSPLSSALNSTGTNNLGQPIQLNPISGLPILGQVFIPNPIPFNGTPGFDIGIIGQRIFNKLTGIEFESIGAFINCLRGITSSNIILNPKIITEDGVPAEIFVGENIAYQTQSIVNDQGVILTSNFEYRDVGARLKVTPYLGASDIIALEIENEITSVISNAQAGLPANSNAGPNTAKSSTVTRVNIPSGCFLVISGMLRDEIRRSDAHAPCLGGIPVLGAAFKSKQYEDQKRNIMIFIQPKIIDTEEEMHCLTRHQQDLLKAKNRRKQDMLYETEEFMDFLNLKKYEHERTSIEFEDDEVPL